MKMKNLFYRLLCLFILTISLSRTSFAAIETIPSGAFIINMGVSPQTYGNGIKPWGMLYDLIKNYKVQVKWIINPSKVKDGVDFVYNGTNYSGGSFIIPKTYRIGGVDTRIAYWQTQGVVGVTTTADISVDVSYTLKYVPRWTFDLQNGAIAIGFLDDAGIPSAGFPLSTPQNLNTCDDLFVMPHADPTWATHSNLYTWNQNNDGWIWAGCHAVSVLENLTNPGNPSQKMNFLSQTGLVPFGSHSDGSPPYSYRYPTDPEMQFIGTTDAAQQNGSEQIFLPQGSTWRPTTQVAVYDPTQANVPGLSPGDAAAIVYGRGFGVSTNGKLMFVGGHNINKNNAAAVSAMRNFFNFSFLSRYDKLVNITISGSITCIALNNYTYRASLPLNVNPNDYTFHWSSTCGGTFSNPNDSVTLFTAPSTSTCFECRLYCEIKDTCGRDFYQDYDINICPGAPLSVNLTSFTGNRNSMGNLLQWKTASETYTDHFEVEYSTNGSDFTQVASVNAAGNSTAEKQYSFLHQALTSRRSYYRLKTIYQDGKFKYSEVVLITGDDIKYVIDPVYPNPFSKQLTVRIDSKLSAPMILTLTDLAGNIVKMKSVLLVKGTNQIEMDKMEAIKNGIYFLRISNEEYSQVLKLIKTND